MQISTLSAPIPHFFSRIYDHAESRAARLKSTLILMMTLIDKRPLHILLADDDEEDREIFAYAIKDLSPDIRMSVAVNGKELMAILNDEKRPLPDILFLDLNMPFKNGHECLKEIRSSDRLKKLPVIIYSTSSSSEHIDLTYQGGADFYLPKPDSFRDLKFITENLFSLDWTEHSKPVKDKFVLSAGYFK